jgi:O-antigen ligase
LKDQLADNPAALMSLEPEFRSGLLRAFGTFSHPILGGVILTSCLPLYYYSRISLIPRAIGALATLGGIFSISSAAIAALAVSIGIGGIDATKVKVRGLSWQLIVTLTAVAMVTIHFASKSGIFNLISRATFNPHTAYTRQQIYTYGWRSIERHPWFGIGYEQYERPSGLTLSIDSHYLAQGVSTGIIPPFAILCLIIYLMFALGNQLGKLRDPVAREMLFGVNLCIFLLFLSGWTVAYFGEAKIWFQVMLGISCSLVLWARKANKANGVVSDK